jgi:GT2 family glycosyltransferase
VQVDWVSGACMLVRRDVFLRVGGFDERYFLYWEDADLCRRIRAAGHTVRYLPAARVVHALGQSSKSAQRLAIREFHRSAYRYYCDHAAPTPWSPARALARLLLSARCRWYLWKSRRVTVPQVEDRR